LSASITYLQTIYQTSSVVYSSGSNILGDEPSDVQTLNGRVDIPMGNLHITGSTTSSLGFFGDLEGTASYATQALSASYAPQDPLPSGLVSGSSQISYTGITDVPSGIVSGSGQLDELGYATTSSVNTKLDTGSFNTYSGDTLNLINTKLDSSSFNSYTSSNDSKVNSLINATGSYVTETESGSFVTNISQGPISFEDQLTITKGNGSSTTLTINNVTNADSSSFSQTSISSSFATQALSASYAPSNPLPSGLVSGSSQISYTGITDVPSGIVSGSSQVSFTGITDVPTGLVSGSSQISDLGFAITGSNTFLGNQIITGSVDVTGSVTLNNLVYPTIDNGEKSFIQSDGNGNLSLQYVDTLLEPIRNGEATTLVKGTPVYVSGSLGANPIVYAADAGDPTKMPVIYIVNENILTNEVGNGILLGKIDGVDTTGYAPGTEIFVGVGGGWTQTRPTGSAIIQSLGIVTKEGVGGQGIVLNPGPANLPNLPTNELFIGDTNSHPVSKTINEIGLATTGSNTFIGSQTIEGDISLSGSNKSITIPEANFIKLYGDADGSSTSAAIQFFSGSGANRYLNIQSVPTSTDGDVAISDFPTNDHFMFFKMSNHTIQFEAALAGTGSAPMETKTGFINNTFYNPSLPTNERGFTNSGSMVVRGNLFNLSNNTNLNPDLYVTNSLVGQTNIIKGWGDNPAAGGPGANQLNYTGSLRITGSNNTVCIPQIRATAVGGNVGHQGYISGSDNTFMSNNSGIYLNTGSLLFPKTTNNYLGSNSSILMNFTTSSLAGGQPLFQNNTLYAGQLNINSNSGSINATGNIINGGSVLSTQNFLTNQRASIGQNIINGQVELNHISSSIQYSSNISNARLVVTNALSSSITNNLLVVGNNTFLGGLGGAATNHSIFVSGSQSSNVPRAINNNLIGGNSNTVSSSFVSSSNSNLQSTLIYGNGLTIFGNNTAGTFGGSAFVGRFNDTISLANAQDIVFAVGTGTSAAARRTSLYVTSGSLVGVSGSLDVKGSSVITGSIQGNVNQLTVVSNTASLNLNDGNFFELQLTGSLDIRIEPTNIKPGQTVNIKLNTTGSGTVSFPTSVKQQSGSAYIPTTEVGTDIITMVSFDNSNIYLANVKNLI
jgi:hypothetical protein